MSFGAGSALTGMKKTHQGSCHCGAVRFECELDLAAGTTRCNCGYCKKARWWMTFVKKGEFRLLQGADALTDYQYVTPSKPAPFLHFEFCRHCGFRAFTRGGDLPALGGEFYAVNVACLDGVSDEDLAAAPIHYADGRHDAWDKTPAETRYL
jgi:hypothetical protein